MQWAQLGLDIEGKTAGDRSGTVVSLSADGLSVAIGAPFNDSTGLNAGHVRVFKLIGGSWIQRGSDINGRNAGDQCGSSVSLSANGDTVAIGAPYNDNIGGINAGQVQVFKLRGGTWVQQGLDINGAAVGDTAGCSVSLSSDGLTLAVGSASYNGFGIGSARIFTLENGAWVQKGGTINGDVSGGYFGAAVALTPDGSSIVIGAPTSDSYGSVSVYKFIDGAWNKQGATIIGQTIVDKIGSSIAISANGLKIAIGRPAAVTADVAIYSLIYDAWVNTGVITGQQHLTNPSNSYFGSSVSFSTDGDTIAVGAKYAREGGSNSGSVCIFNYTGGSWVKMGANIVGEASADYSGTAVSLSADGSTVAIGAPSNDGVSGTDVGHVRVYTYNQIPTTSISTLTASEITTISSTVVVNTLSLQQLIAIPQSAVETAASESTTGNAVVTGLVNALASIVSKVLTDTVSTTGAQKTDIDAALRLASIAQAARGLNASVTATTVENANLQQINAAGLNGTTAIVAAALPPRATGAAVECTLTSTQETTLSTGGQFYIAGAVGEKLTFVSLDGQRSVQFEFPEAGKVKVNGVIKSIGDTVVTAFGTIHLLFGGSLGAQIISAPAPTTGPICFLADAPVLTPSGYRPISAIAVGDLVRTAAGCDVSVKRVFIKEYAPSALVNPYVIPKGAFGALRALPISPNHEVMTKKGMVKAKNLGLPRMKITGSFTYYNLELQDWVRDNLVVAGVECESLSPAARITMTKARFAQFVKARYGPSAATRLRSVCFEELNGQVSMPALQ